MQLFLCEKSSQARDIARVLGATQKGRGVPPRTNCTYLPEDQIAEAPKILATIKRSDAKFAALGGIWRSSRSRVGASVMRGAVSSP